MYLLFLQSLVPTDTKSINTSRIGSVERLENAVKPTGPELGRAASWALSLDKLLEDAVGLATFMVSKLS